MFSSVCEIELGLQMHAVIEHVCIYMYIPVHVYRSLPLEHFVQVGV